MGEKIGHTHIVNITDRGDLVLRVGGKPDGDSSFFRVDSQRLIHVSPYFESLLANERFKEAAFLRDAHERLREEGLQPSQVSADRLPRIFIAEMGQASPGRGTDHLTSDFLRILHGQDIAYARPGLRYIASLTNLADMFDSLPVVVGYVKRKGFVEGLDAKGKGKNPADISEEGLRQRILVGWLFDKPHWFRTYTFELISRGSSRWTSAEDVSEGDQSLWWNLPHGIEGMVAHSRPVWELKD